MKPVPLMIDFNYCKNDKLLIFLEKLLQALIYENFYKFALRSFVNFDPGSIAGISEEKFETSEL